MNIYQLYGCTIELSDDACTARVLDGNGVQVDTFTGNPAVCQKHNKPTPQVQAHRCAKAHQNGGYTKPVKEPKK